VADGADKSGGLEDRSHAFRGMDESAKRVLSEAIPRVFQHDGGAYIPRVARIGERDHAARAGGRSPEQRLHIRVTTDDAVECDDIGVRQGVCGRGEVTEEELGEEWSIARGQVAPGSFEITGGRIRERDAGQAGGGEFHCDYTNATADVEKTEALQRPAAEFLQDKLRCGVRTAALIAVKVTLRLLGIEVGGCSARAGATRHGVNLDGVEGCRWEC